MLWAGPGAPNSFQLFFHQPWFSYLAPTHLLDVSLLLGFQHIVFLVCDTMARFYVGVEIQTQVLVLAGWMLSQPSHLPTLPPPVPHFASLACFALLVVCTVRDGRLDIPSLYFLSKLSWWCHVSHGLKCHLFMRVAQVFSSCPEISPNISTLGSSYLVDAFLWNPCHSELNISKISVSSTYDQANLNQRDTYKLNFSLHLRYSSSGWST